MNRLLFAAAVIAVAIWLANPKRGEPWNCPQCGTPNDPGRSQCMNGCGSRGPLAPPPRPAPDGGS